MATNDGNCGTSFYLKLHICSYLICGIINTDEDPSLRVESFAIINLRGVSTKLNKYIDFTMQMYKELIDMELSFVELIMIIQ